MLLSSSFVRLPLLAAAALVLSTVGGAALASGPTVAAPAPADLGLTEQQWNDVLRGRMVRTYPGDEGDRDLAIGLTFLAPVPPELIARNFVHALDLASDDSVVAFGAIHGSEADFAALKLAPAGAEEARRYLHAEPGDTLNLSRAESAAFRGLGAKAAVADVEALLRKTLKERYQAYRAAGLAGIKSYARSSGVERQPADDLVHIPALIHQRAPGYQALLLGYPKAKPDDLQESYSWVVSRQGDRPTVSLRHRMITTVNGVLLASEHEFYVSQGHNAAQVLVALVPHENQTLVVYRAHASTDQVAGAARAMKHGIGRGVMAKQLERLFEKLRRRRVSP